LIVAVFGRARIVVVAIDRGLDTSGVHIAGVNRAGVGIIADRRIVDTACRRVAGIVSA